MSRLPRLATVYGLLVPDEEIARTGARELAVRGHALVRVSRAPGPGWRIDSVDEGPFSGSRRRWRLRSRCAPAI